MRHLKNTCKLGKTTPHRRCMFANMLKSIITHGSIETTVQKAKVLRRYADRMITLAKENTLAARRRAISELMIRYNPLTEKEKRAARGGDISAYNDDRQVISQLFDVLGPHFEGRQGGYTRIVRLNRRKGDNAETCLIEYVAEKL